MTNHINIKGVYAAGRLDYDSEGLLILTDDGKLQQRIANPKYRKTKQYWVQVEGVPDQVSLARLRQGIDLKDGRTRPAQVELIKEPPVWARTPPIRKRKNTPDAWLNIGIQEGRNRQVRRMTAHIGYPTLRLVRHQIGEWKLADIPVGEYRILNP